MTQTNRINITRSHTLSECQKLRLSTKAVVLAGITAESFIRLGHSSFYARTTATQYAIATDKSSHHE